MIDWQWLAQQLWAVYGVSGVICLLLLGAVYKLVSREHPCDSAAAKIIQSRDESFAVAYIRETMRKGKDPEFATEEHGKLTIVNDALCDLVGAHRGDLLRDGWVTFLYPDDRLGVLDSYQDAVTRQIDWQRDFRLKVKGNGTTLHVRCTASCMRTPNGKKFLGYVGTVKRTDEKVVTLDDLADLITTTSVELTNLRIELKNEGQVSDVLHTNFSNRLESIERLLESRGFELPIPPSQRRRTLRTLKPPEEPEKEGRE